MTDSDEPVTNYCSQCSVGIGNATGLCGDCAKQQADSPNGDDRS